ncbi:nuclear transport factor 2 family protein [Nocardia abscessus]|uniref:nuclear transport factor 2 family protein n=1 Tax=Nocardia abscessus TaxID=120957 RepID=UPI00245541EA|nr:nuclear transport factor 2 family protein [Nocardia abscessus]
MTGDTLATVDIESTIRSLEHARYAAVLAGDIDGFAALAHPDLVYTHSNAEVDTLDSYVGKLRAGHYVYHRIEHPIARIVVTADTAMVIGEMHADITAGGVRKRLANRVLAVWLREGGRWLLLAYWPTVIPEAVR